MSFNESFPGIGFVYIWYLESPPCSQSEDQRTLCQDDLLYTVLPGVASLLLAVLLVSLHNWVLVVHVTKSMRKMLNPEPFVRIGSRIVLGLEDTSHGEQSTNSSTLSKSSTLFSYVYP